MSKVASAYSSSAGTHPFIKIFLAIIILLTVGLFLENSSSSNSMISKLTNIGGKKALRLLTWNIAAINNNPFEYWITSDDSGYNKIMKSVAEFIEQPAAKDVPINQVFTDSMASELFAEMERVGWSGVKETREQWESSYKGRKIISEFVKDSVLGKKRLASMPDRVTNTINT